MQITKIGALHKRDETTILCNGKPTTIRRFKDSSPVLSNTTVEMTLSFIVTSLRTYKTQ